MSPEGLILNVYGEKTDMWALGIVAYEMVHGRTPFSFCRDDAELKYWIVRPLGEHLFRKDMHPCLRRLVELLLQVEEGQRPNVDELLKMPIFDHLEELAKISKIDSQGRRKFSFNEKSVSTHLFQKKSEVSLLNAKQPQKQEVNRSMGSPAPHVKPSSSFSFKNSQKQEVYQQTPPKLVIPQQTGPLSIKTGRESIRFCLSSQPLTMPSTSKLQKTIAFWEGEGSHKTT